ncbi:hypothetical protein N7G274_010128 [Stereocaulon virgatum]|uniref:Uncharacterized protein n=1 Tax=Stereocaulon virgatum TaxID=373712 RepID=A0ABR3ZU80_9LECA
MQRRKENQYNTPREHPVPRKTTQAELDGQGFQLVKGRHRLHEQQAPQPSPPEQDTRGRSGRRQSPVKRKVTQLESPKHAPSTRPQLDLDSTPRLQAAPENRRRHSPRQPHPNLQRKTLRELDPNIRIASAKKVRLTLQREDDENIMETATDPTDKDDE